MEPKQGLTIDLMECRQQSVLRKVAVNTAVSGGAWYMFVKIHSYEKWFPIDTNSGVVRTMMNTTMYQSLWMKPPH